MESIGVYKVYNVFRKDTKEVVYIGITKRTLKKRLQSHFNRKDHNPKKVNYFYKYRELLKIGLLEGNIEKLKDANKLEIKYIKEFKSKGCKLLNATDGGDGTVGVVSWNKGLKCDYKDKLMKNSPNKKVVYSYNLKGNLIAKHNSIKKAFEETGVPRSAIKNIADLKIRFRSFNGLTFRYFKEDSIDLNYISEAERIKKVKKGKLDSCYKVIITENSKDVIYKNIFDAAIAIGIKPTSVSVYCSRELVRKNKKFRYDKS